MIENIISNYRPIYVWYFYTLFIRLVNKYWYSMSTLCSRLLLWIKDVIVKLRHSRIYKDFFFLFFYIYIYIKPEDRFLFHTIILFRNSINIKIIVRLLVECVFNNKNARPTEHILSGMSKQCAHIHTTL